MGKSNYTYEIVEDGYYILRDGKKVIEQRGVFADVILPNQSYEKMHLHTLMKF